MFKFHNYFDGLLGIDYLSNLNAQIDLAKNIIKTDSAVIPLHHKPNLCSERFLLEPNTKKMLNLPVDVEFGDIWIPETQIGNNIIISSGIYKANKWFSLLEVSNISNNVEVVYLEQPIKVHNYCSSMFFEIHSLDIESPRSEEVNDIRHLLRLDHLNNEERKLLLKTCKKYSEIFYREGQKLTFSNKIRHSIPTNNEIPVYTKSYRYPYVHKNEVQDQISKLLNQNIIRPSYSPWSSPVWIVPKKKDASGKQKWRLVIDFRKVNEKTITDKYPIPNINELLDKLGRCVYFSTVDLASGFHQIEMNPKDIPKTAFSVEGGHYEFIRMPFGLKNAPSTFQRVMDNILRELIGKICLVYLDDIIIFGTSLQEHISNLELVFEKLRESNFKIQLDKSEFLRKEIEFLGHIVSTEGIKPNPNKISAVKNFPIPRTAKNLKSFLGLLGYYRKFIPNFAKLTKPLTVCLKKGMEIKLTESYVKTFEMCKNLLCNDPILQYPDFSKDFILTTDASNFALGAVLSQGQIGNDKPICYASRTLNTSETNYSTIEKELLAIVWATRYFRPYLFGRKFKIVTDHRPLTWIMGLKEPNSKLVRWRLKLEEFEYEIVYKKGTQNTNADALSRIKVDLNNHEITPIANTSSSTIHSAEENQEDGIPISEKPLNEFSIQIIFEVHPESKVTIEVPFKNKIKKIINSPTFDENSIIKIFVKHFKPHKLIAIYSEDNIFRIIQKVFSTYFSNNKTYRLVRCTQRTKDIKDNDEQDDIIRKYHRNSNHRGIDETYLHLKKEYFFPNMKYKISQIINNCDICHTLKYDRHPQKIVYQIPETPSKPLDIIHIDIYHINHQQILTIIDKFSKFAAGFTITARTSLNVIKSLKNFISTYGIPKKIICDQGKEFTAIIFQDFCKQFDIHLHITSFQQSSSNAPIERLHSTLTELYRIITAKRKESKLPIDHDEIFSEALITYNNSVHSTTKLTPYELFFGRPQVSTKEIKFNKEHEYLQKLNEYQQIIYPKIQEKMQTSVKKRIEKLNKSRIKPKNLKTNDIVFRKENRRNKITARFSKHVVKNDKNIAFITEKNQKIHKSKIKRNIKRNNNTQ